MCEDDPNEVINIHLAVTSNTLKITVDPAMSQVVIDDTNEPDCSELFCRLHDWYSHVPIHRCTEITLSSCIEAT